MDRPTRNLIFGLTATIVLLLGLLVISVLYAAGVRQRLMAMDPSHNPLLQIAQGGIPLQPWNSSQVAGAKSVEWQLHEQGKRWVRTNDVITVGSYVEDILDPRLNQPTGRGAIGKVVAISPPGNGPVAANVDFGRGYVTGIDIRELACVVILPQKR